MSYVDYNTLKHKGIKGMKWRHHKIGTDEQSSVEIPAITEEEVGSKEENDAVRKKANDLHLKNILSGAKSFVSAAKNLSIKGLTNSDALKNIISSVKSTVSNASNINKAASRRMHINNITRDAYNNRTNDRGERIV